MGHSVLAVSVRSWQRPTSIAKPSGELFTPLARPLQSRALLSWASLLQQQVPYSFCLLRSLCCCSAVLPSATSMRGAQSLLVAALGIPFSSLGTVHAEKVAVAPGHTAGTGKRQDNFQTDGDNHNSQDSGTQRRQASASATARGEGSSATAATTTGTSSTAGSTTCSEEGGNGAVSCVVEPQTDQAEQQQQQQQQQRQLQQRQQRQQQQQQQQQQKQREQAQRSGGGGVEVKTGDQDGIRIDFIGTSDGSSPELVPPSPPVAAAKRKASQEDKLATKEESLKAAAAAAATAEMPFGLLRCDGESHRDGKDGGLTVKVVCDHMLSKLMESAQRVRMILIVPLCMCM